MHYCTCCVQVYTSIGTPEQWAGECSDSTADGVQIESIVQSKQRSYANCGVELVLIMKTVVWRVLELQAALQLH